MTFLNPWMLLGGLTVGIPLALHFFYRAHYRPVPWAAMKFLRLALEQTSRRLRFQELVLLILRVLVCLILAVALSRPASKSLTAGGGRGDSVDAVIIIDNSYSMNAAEGEKTRLDRAKDAALKVIDNLPPNSTAQIVSCSSKATNLGPRSPSNLDQARRIVKNLKTSSLSTDFLDGFTEALQAFGNMSGASKEVYLISDMQRSGWERQTTALRSKCEEIKNQASIYLVRCAEEKVQNVAIIGILPQTDIPHVNSAVAFTVLLRNSGSAAVDNLDVTLTVDGQQEFNKDSAAVNRIEPGETRAVTISGKLEKAGWQLLTARINDVADAHKPDHRKAETKRDRANQDAIEDDNSFSMLVLVHERIRVLIVDGSPDDLDPKKSGSYFIANALLPIPEDQRDAYHLAVSITAPENAGEDSLADRNVCILANVAANQLRPEFVKALHTFVRSGNGLFIGSGSNVVAGDYNIILGELLPAGLPDVDPYETPRDDRPAPDLASVDVYSFLAKLQEKGINPLQGLAAGFAAKITPVLDPENAKKLDGRGRVLMRFNDGRPMLLAKNVGAGEVMMLTTSVDSSWTVLCHYGSFVPFINGCIADLLNRSGAAYNHTAGESVRWAPEDPLQDYVLIRPDLEHTFLGKPKESNGQYRLPAFDTSQAGIYRIAPAGKERQGERFVFNADLAESENLEAIPDDQIDKQLGFQPVHLKTGFDGTEFTGTERSRNEWTIWVLSALLCLTLGETLWAWFCGRSW